MVCFLLWRKHRCVGEGLGGRTRSTEIQSWAILPGVGISNWECGLGPPYPFNVEHLLTSPTEKAFIRVLSEKECAIFGYVSINLMTLPEIHLQVDLTFIA